MTTRRRLLIAVGIGAIAVRCFALAQPRIWRVGFFYFGSRRSAMESGRYAAFIEGLRDLGYADGRNIALELRFADGKVERLAAMADELLQWKPDVIVATGTPVYAELKRVTTTVPVVMTVTADPVLDGFATSVARPGKNFTGLSTLNVDLFAKQIELMKIAMPKLSRVALLWNSGNPAHPAQLKAMREIAKRTGLLAIEASASTAEEIERSFASMVHQHAEAIIILPDTFFVQQFGQIAALALKQRLPSIYGAAEYAEAGGFMAYGRAVTLNFRGAASYVDKILKGANPADLPIEQPMRLELAINRGTAKSIGLAIPQELLLRADRVIE